ncbi:hypothetical protein M9458_043400, partial [Cirrhinus mrigala]
MVEIGSTDGDGAGESGQRQSQGDSENPEGQGEAEGSGDRGRDPESCSGARATKDEGRAGRKEGRSDEAKLEEWSPKAADGQRLTKVEPEGRRSPVEL